MSNLGELNVKQCCAGFYGSELAHLLLGESFHPGGAGLTERLGQLMQLTRDFKVLDVAAGRGASGFHIAEKFGCEVVGMDLSETNVRVAAEEAFTRGVADRVKFRTADAEALPFEDDSFDAILCECAFCTFPDKQKAASEFARVLKPTGHLGLSDLTRTVEPLSRLDDVLSWVACIGDAKPLDSYVDILQHANLAVLHTENHDQALIDLIRQIQGRLLVAEVTTALQKLDSPGIDFAKAKSFVHAALAAVNNRCLGYALLTACKPA